MQQLVAFRRFFFDDAATTVIYTLSLHDALPIWASRSARCAWSSTAPPSSRAPPTAPSRFGTCRDRKSTRLNFSHSQISYAVFCLKKKKPTHRLRSHVIAEHISGAREPEPRLTAL